MGAILWRPDGSAGLADSKGHRRLVPIDEPLAIRCRPEAGVAHGSGPSPTYRYNSCWPARMLWVKGSDGR